MGNIYRSEEMCLAQLYLQSESAYNCVAELGELGLVQFRDLNPDVNAFQRKFVNEVRRCDEMERKLRFLEKEIKKDEIPMLDTLENPEAPQPKEMIDLEATFEKLENELKEVNQNEEMLRKNFAELTELKHILRKTQQFFEEEHHSSLGTTIFGGAGQSGFDGDQEHLLNEVAFINDKMQLGFAGNLDASSISGGYVGEHADSDTIELTSAIGGISSGVPVSFGNFGFVCGVIERVRLPAFERLLWRACRGNVFLRQSDITEVMTDPHTGDKVNKTVFIIFFQGDQLKQRVKKICEGFRATLYPCPESPTERREMSIGVITRIEDLKTVLGQTTDHRHRVLVAAAKNVKMWLTKVRKIKAIYHTMNLFNMDVTKKCLVAECWCPVDDLDRIQFALKRGTEESGSHIPSILQRMSTNEAPPTFNKTNKFTRGFQNIVDAYGIASYREINPAPYTMVTFPFLFAVMFGDMGHGLIMLMFALFLILKEKSLEAAKIRDEIFQTFFGGRYVIFLMGAFSVYTGFIYNDAFSKSINIFGSSWKNIYSFEHAHLGETATLWPDYSYDNASGPYPMGVDPVWNLAEVNRLNFLNSMKMKASVILGVTQMTFGLMLSYHNHKYFNSDLDIKYMFIPQMIFLGCIFIYLCLQIIFKWLLFDFKAGYYILGFYYPSSQCAPSLLIGLINMFMMKDMGHGFTEGDSLTPAPSCQLRKWYPGQAFFETIFLLLAMACIPVMLFAKPYFLWKQDKEGRGNGHRQLSVRASIDGDSAEVVHAEENDSSKAPSHGHGHGDGPFDIADIMVYQAIHTIEFALGCISHTASYLRLWALSLAHAQLSDVLWTMVFRNSFIVDGYLGAVCTYVLFFCFFFGTIFILVLMEGLSAFLHALRLHWVEFQSKFYGGNGYIFAPFAFETLLEEARVADDSSK
ncbi:V-type ATPase, V0 complex, 116kDa subunit family and ATPase, V0 complex, subunit 116kDa, eukaryotic family-containing protein [Strongyloides ratti]|uniref:V-type proton ATPase subunit a n=1 Tax=Strongyloides ratti TaxID=34506 RepID=A0A090LF69_STRRB|nr:V-type ATPase, V0 complex, 116kDa subunit family and ATPase, V0 complex, subunit 116kDa, eukaryotic family-containing protein [Strongyloides ratti]CEF66773.1 V-type ATPase, V0 complex, 116kDa subunit family and ATPase, V0 complex, subunit 116kDa, eukaryotic family-containing protein [Strongyloides ratti]